MVLIGGDARELLGCVTNRCMNVHAGPWTQREGAAQALELPFRVLDMGACANIWRVYGTFDLLSEWVRVDNVYDVNLGLVDRSNESAGLLEQVFADVAQVHPHDKSDAAGLLAW
jgi:hypothetical protein